jgi:hypothetical protein
VLEDWLYWIGATEGARFRTEAASSGEVTHVRSPTLFADRGPRASSSRVLRHFGPFLHDAAFGFPARLLLAPLDLPIAEPEIDATELVPFDLENRRPALLCVEAVRVGRSRWACSEVAPVGSAP